MGMRSFTKKMTFMAVFLGSILLIGLSQEAGYAQNRKKVDQLNFRLPEDWPVEKRGGLVTPIPTEEYVSMKFKEVEKEFQSIRDELSKTFAGLQEDLKGIEQDLSRQGAKDQSQEVAPSASSTDIVSNVESLKSEVGRLDRKITSKMQETQGRLEEINLQIGSIKQNLKNIQAQIYKLDEKVDYWQDNELRSY